MNARNEFAEYFVDLSRLPLLTREEELDLSRRTRQGDANARHRLVEGNLRLVVQIAKRFHGGAMPLADLVAEGNVGLLLAVDRFDPELGYRFSTYAAWWIRQCIGKALQRTAHIVHFGAAQLGSARVLRRKNRELRSTLGREPTPAELRAATGATAERFATTTRAVHLLDTRWTNCDAETAALAGDPSPEDSATDRDVLDELRRKVARLDTRSRMIIELRFGLGGERPRKLSEIGVRIGLTRERVRQILQELLFALRGDESVTRLVKKSARRSRKRSADVEQDLSRAAS
jgi:RNA polymerase sigma factor (sigma-70 family)